MFEREREREEGGEHVCVNIIGDSYSDYQLSSRLYFAMLGN
jgi:hypothetical protein